MITLELALAEELEIYTRIIDAGRAFQQEQGFVQWTEDYPTAAILQQDIQHSKGYVVRVDGTVAGYMCIDFDGEPAYAHIEGAWQTPDSYAVVHRMALDPAFRGIGLTGTVFALIEALCREKGIPSIRVDTDFPNKRMQHILEKYGFVQRGVIYFQGGGKLAYDKMVE